MGSRSRADPFFLVGKRRFWEGFDPVSGPNKGVEVNAGVLVGQRGGANSIARLRSGAGDVTGIAPPGSLAPGERGGNLGHGLPKVWTFRRSGRMVYE